jgi:hypothetical protein
LVGQAADWWDAYVESHEERKTINWQEFRNSFRTHHVLLGVTRFTQLSRYAPDNVDTDEKKQDWFLNRLNDGLAYAPEARNFENFEDMVDKALVLKNRRGIMERKRKIQRTGALGSNKRFHEDSPSQGPIFHSSQ